MYLLNMLMVNMCIYKHGKDIHANCFAVVACGTVYVRARPMRLARQIGRRQQTVGNIQHIHFCKRPKGHRQQGIANRE